MDAAITPRAFELNPAAPKTTSRYGLEMIATRYGISIKQAKAEFDKIAAMAREDGIEFTQDHTHAQILMMPIA